jgi:hypothetical protein
MKEVWKDIKGYEGLYQVSNYGRIKSLSRLIKNSNNRITKEKIRKQVYDKDNYLTISLSKNGKISTFKVHRLVAQAFIPNTKNKPTVNHKNGIKNDNKVENLEWATDKEQMEHCIKILGYDPHIKKTYPKKVKRSDGKIYDSIKEASIENNVSSSNITMSCQGKCKKIGGYTWNYI